RPSSDRADPARHSSATISRNVPDCVSIVVRQPEREAHDVTLRARLTAAFLVVVLGPVVLGAIFVGITVSAVGTERTQDRLDVAADSVSAAVGAVCQRLRLAAETAAL